MPKNLDPVAEGMNEYDDEKSMKHEPWLEYHPGRRLNFERRPETRGVEVPPQQKLLLQQRYKDFLKDAYARASFADEASGRGNTGEESADFLEKIEADMKKAAQLFALKENKPADWYTGPRAHGLPDMDLFENYLLPCAAQLAEKPQDVDRIFDDALTCLNDLMMSKFQATSSSGVSYHFYEAFFSNKSSPRNSHKADKDFAFYYAYYGRKFALLAAAIQGRREDEHYDGGSYSYSQYLLNTYFLAPFEYIPEQYHDDVLDMTINIARNSNKETVTYFLEGIRPVIAVFEKTGDPSLLHDYFDLCRNNAFQLRQLQEIRVEAPLPFFLDGEASVDQMKALAALGPHKPAAMSMTRFLMEKDRWRWHEIFFTKYTRKEWYERSEINFTEVVGKLRAAGKSDAEINEVLTMHQNHPWLGELTGEICGDYTKHEKKHPDGAAAMIARLEKMQQSPGAMSGYVHGYKSYPWDHPQINEFLALGTFMANVFPNRASWYFSDCDGKNSVKNICDNIGRHGVEKFQTVIARLKAISKKFTGLEHQELVGRLMKHIFIDLIDDPRLDDLLEGINQMAILNADNGKRKNYFSETGVMDAFNFLLSGVIPKWRDGEDHSASPAGDSPRILDVEILPNAKILGEYAKANQGIPFRDDDLSVDLIRQGLDAQIVLENYFFAMRRFEGHYDQQPDNASFSFLKALNAEQGRDAVVEVASCIFDARKAIKKTLSTERWYDVPRIPGKEQNLSAPALREQIGRLDKMMLHPACSQAKALVTLKNDLAQAQQMIVFREMLKAGSAPALIRKRNEPQSELLATGSETTRIIVSGAALLSAIGAMELPGISTPQLPQAEKVQKLLLTQGTTGTDAHELPTIMADCQDTIRERIETFVPQIEQLILAARKEAPGLMPEGGKIHTLGTLDQRLIEYVQNLFGLSSTSFRLIHSGKTLLLPPAPTAFELQLLIAVLAKFGVMDTQSPDLQVAMGGRLPEDLAAISGISVMLSTDTGSKYAEGAFQTTHDKETGSRIMAYDAGEKIRGLPYDREDAKGRTDMLGRRSLLDIQNYRIVHTLLTDYELGGIFYHLGREYVEDFTALMQKYGLEKLQKETTWIFNPDRNKETKVDSVENHEKVVGKVSDAWFKASEMVDYGVIREMRELIDRNYRKIRERREQIIEDDPDEYQKYLSF